MHPGELAAVTEALVDAIAEATDHEPCDGPCLLCGDAGSDLYTVLYGLERALSTYFSMPEAHATDAAAQVEALLDDIRYARPYLVAPVPGAGILPPLDPGSAQRLYIYLKAVALDLAHGSGWPRIET
jgi:hypothetical protein